MEQSTRALLYGALVCVGANIEIVIAAYVGGSAVPGSRLGLQQSHSICRSGETSPIPETVASGGGDD